ncbi:hypothetical protein [Kitasatospora camelliae]|uniref:Glycoside hydrolase family 5 C-terminal domain-containing protein n=1 Tax=Kitasatospora camelliae TaxID=3156397 RepID=A0AAU8JS17_9ACTN
MLLSAIEQAQKGRPGRGGICVRCHRGRPRGPYSTGTSRHRNTGPDPAIVRPCPRHVAGTPQQCHYDSATGTFTLRYSARRADSGQPFARGARTEVCLPQSTCPDGYRVESQGAEVVSAPDVRLLPLATGAGQDTVQVTVVRG